MSCQLETTERSVKFQFAVDSDEPDKIAQTLVGSQMSTLRVRSALLGSGRPRTSARAASGDLHRAAGESDRDRQRQPGRNRRSGAGRFRSQSVHPTPLVVAQAEQRAERGPVLAQSIFSSVHKQDGVYFQTESSDEHQLTVPAPAKLAPTSLSGSTSVPSFSAAQKQTVSVFPK